MISNCKRIYKIIKFKFFPSEMEKTIKKWRSDKGEENLRLNYDLNENSIVFDVGGYEGAWSKKIFEKYKSNIYIFEPIEKFYTIIKENFTENKKIKCFNFGLADKNEETYININKDASSTNICGKNKIKIKLKSISKFIREEGLKKIDLMKINIEGDEYKLLNDLLDSGEIRKVKNIQVQFHNFIPDAKNKMEDIKKKLLKTHRATYQYEFVWENWTKK